MFGNFLARAGSSMTIGEAASSNGGRTASFNRINTRLSSSANQLSSQGNEITDDDIPTSQSKVLHFNMSFDD